MKRKICVITGTRAEFGLTRWLMDEIKKSSNLSLQLIVTGTHLSPEYGHTVWEIEKAGFEIDLKLDMLLSSNTAIGVTKSIGMGTIGFADAFENLKPDIVVVLGDRYEIFSAVTSAMISGIPIAHIHGGEVSEGAFDEAIRHSISKMSHLHFVAAEDYRKRVIQLGEQPDRVFNVGGMGIDALSNIKLLSRTEIENDLGLSFGAKSLLVTFHPITLDTVNSSKLQMVELLNALKSFKDITIIFTAPNADTGSNELLKLVQTFVNSNANSYLYTSLGQLRYFSCMKQVNGLVGNSSSGLLEAPSFKIGTINIGDRQQGRLKSKSVIDTAPDTHSIISAIENLFSAKFQKGLEFVENPYGEPGASKMIKEKLESVSLDKIRKKKFHDL